MRHIYGADHVIYVRNITDVDDKINARAERDYPALPLNEAIAKVTEATERQFHEDVAALGALSPTVEPRATQYIDKMRAMIERLVARGVAYVAEDHVLFSPSAMDALPGAPRYGALARRSLDEMLAGARVDVAPYKRDPMDFVLWKPSKPSEPSWPSPAGIAAPGRPGWHIECSAMTMATLIEPFGGGLECDDPSRNAFDIHGGGIDLVFPHHENEIAQSCCAFGSSRMANVWMHNGFLQVESEKMSKSLGNFVTIRELLRHDERSAVATGREKCCGSRCCARIIASRSTGRSEAWRSAEKTLDRWYEAVGDFGPVDEIFDPMLEALSDDLNTPARSFGCRSLQGGNRPRYALPCDFVGFRSTQPNSSQRVLPRASAIASTCLQRQVSANVLGLLNHSVNRVGALRPALRSFRSHDGHQITERGDRTSRAIVNSIADRIGRARSRERTGPNPTACAIDLAAAWRRHQGQQGRYDDLGAQAMSAVALRPYVPADARRCAEIFRLSIEELAAEDYDADQREAWASRADDEEAFGARLANALTLLAVIGGAIAGFASLKGGDEIDMLFVDPEFARRGVGWALVDALTRLAGARGAKRLTAEASDVARPLFERQGFTAQKRNLVRKGDQWLANTTMTKPLDAAPPPTKH